MKRSTGLLLAAAMLATPIQAQVAPRAPVTAQTPQRAPVTAQPAQRAPVAAQAARGWPNTGRLTATYAGEKRVPGIVVAVGGTGPTVILASGGTSYDTGAAKVDADTLWRIYSMTKPITGMAAMLLVEDGRLTLDQPIGDILPAFRSMRVLTDPANGLASRPAARPITVRHLLTHSAGLGYSIVTTGPLRAEYERLGILPLSINAQAETAMARVRPQSLAAFADRVATLPLIADPGTKWSYSIGLDVLARVIEVAGGMSFERFVQTRLFDPLDMRSTFWRVPASQAHRLVTNYAMAGDNRVPIDPAATSVFLSPPGFPYGGAGLVSSARDYDRFLHMLQDGGILNGRRVMKAETAALAMSDLLPAGVKFGAADGTTGGTDAPRMGFGAGGSVYLAGVPSGLGKGTYGWTGAAGTIGFVDPANRVRATVMANYFPADRWPLRADVTKAMLMDLKR